MNIKSKALLLLFVSAAIFSCGGGNNKMPETDIEAANQFVQDIWQSDFKKAEKLLLLDETNKQTLDGFAVYYKRKPKEELEKYKNATLILNNVNPLNDSVSIVNYSPSFNKTEKNELKLVRKNGQWLIDLKYTIPQTDNNQQ